jgi:hypothetical protein
MRVLGWSVEIAALLFALLGLLVVLLTLIADGLSASIFG